MRRQNKRRHLAYVMKVYDDRTGVRLGNLVNITRSGVMIVSPDEIPAGQTINLRIVLPEGVADADELVLEGTSVWGGSDYDPTKFITGFSLAGTSEAENTVIDRIIERYGFVE